MNHLEEKSSVQPLRINLSKCDVIEHFYKITLEINHYHHRSIHVQRVTSKNHVATAYVYNITVEINQSKEGYVQILRVTARECHTIEVIEGITVEINCSKKSSVQLMRVTLRKCVVDHRFQKPA